MTNTCTACHRVFVNEEAFDHHDCPAGARPVPPADAQMIGEAMRRLLALRPRIANADARRELDAFVQSRDHGKTI